MSYSDWEDAHASVKTDMSVLLGYSRLGESATHVRGRPETEGSTGASPNLAN